MPFLQLDDVRIFYTDTDTGLADDGTGEGPPLLLVHGYTADSHDWSWQIPVLAEHHRVIALDLRGHGASGVAPGGYTTEQFVADLVELIDHLAVERVVAFGHSMGGSIVSMLAVEHPERVAGVVAVDPAYLIEGDAAGALAPVLEGIDDDALPLFVQSIVGDGMDAPARDPGLRTWQVRRIETMAPHVLRQTLLAQVSGMVSRSESERYLPRRRCPVLAFHTDPARAELEATLVDDDRSHVVAWEGSGHWLHQERAAELNAIVLAWLDDLS